MRRLHISAGVMDIVDAATVVCLRESNTSNISNISSKSSKRTWEVLLGQNEVKNWLRSTPETTMIMRYPGEWKFPGGSRDASDENLEMTARRELEEEFLGINAPPSLVLHEFGTKVTLPVKGKRFRMHNFIALASQENPWLLDTALVDRVNDKLAERRQKFEEALEDGSFWHMSTEEREKLSPEVHSVAWFPIQQAIDLMDPQLHHVNAFQREEFARYGVSGRDPMYQSRRILEEIASMTKEELTSARARV